MMNEFFHSVFSPKIPFSIQDVKLRNPEITNFEISKKAIYEILLSLDATKSRGPNGILPAFFQRTARETSTARLKKANKVLYLLRRNIALQVRQEIKLGLYKSLILPVLLYGCACTNPNRGELQQLERFQKKVVKWILGQKVMPYPNQLRLLNILPLPMFMHLNDILLLSKLKEDDSFLPMLKQNSEKGRINELFKLPKTGTEKG